MKVNFYYFSGTGNTFLVVQAMAEAFLKQGFETDIRKIEETRPEEIATDGIVGLAFTGAMGSTYPLVWEFIENLPEVKACPVFVVYTMAGYTGGTLEHLRKILLKKGYKLLGAKEIIMPSNIFYIDSPQRNQRKIMLGLKKAQRYAQALTRKKASWPRLFILSQIIYAISKFFLWISQRKWHQRLFRFAVKKQLCTKCGLCIKQCPVKNISADKDNYPVFNLHCQYCLRCAGYCPVQAIPGRFSYKGKVYRAPDYTSLTK